MSSQVRQIRKRSEHHKAERKQEKAEMQSKIDMLSDPLSVWHRLQEKVWKLRSAVEQAQKEEQVQRVEAENGKTPLEQMRKRFEENESVWQREWEDMQWQVNRMQKEMLAAENAEELSAVVFAAQVRTHQRSLVGEKVSTLLSAQVRGAAEVRRLVVWSGGEEVRGLLAAQTACRSGAGQQ
jgi:beta-glucosidase-like glycosyl hydrolase